MNLKSHAAVIIESGQLLEQVFILVDGIKNQATGASSQLRSGVILFLQLTHILRTCVQLHCKGLHMVYARVNLGYNVFYKGVRAETYRLKSKTRFVAGLAPSESAGMDLVMNISSQVFDYLSSSHVLKFHKNLSGGAS